MTKWKIYNQDVIEWAKEYKKGKFHALISDTPYELKFMGQKWDSSGIPFKKETWQALGEHLYEGGFGMCFSASRNWHRLAVAIEDAGMIIHPTIFGWLNGQGFPKATRVKNFDGFVGHRYGLQALKPAVEPIIVFQKPYEGKAIENITRTGAGALNIDGGRIPLATGDEYSINTFNDGAKPFGNGAGHKFTSRKVKEDIASSPLGRWPANFILDESVAERLNSQSGDLKAGTATANSGAMGYHGGRRGSTPEMTYADNGGASRFFFNVQEQIDEADPIYYCAKVSPKERNAGLDEMPETLGGSLDGGNDTRNGKNKPQLHSTRNPHPTLKPIALAKYLATLLLPPEGYGPRRILVPFSGVSSEMIGCALAGWEHVVGIEFMEEYVELGKKRLGYWIPD
jgi:site-specific DNA-methyltransferase (adenine-specific)